MTSIDDNRVGSILRQAAAKHPERDVFRTPLETFSYLALWERALNHAAGMRALGIGSGAHVGILMPNTIDFAAIYFATTMIGAVAVPLNTRYNPQELAYVIQNADIAALCVKNTTNGERDLYERLREAFPDLKGQGDAKHLTLADAPKLRMVVSFDENRDAKDLVSLRRLKEAAQTVPVDEIYRAMDAVKDDDTAIICYTSGSTANPKGCVISHRAMVFGWMAGANALGITADDIVWGPCPLYHLSTLGPLTFVVGKGATLLTQEYFEPVSAIDMLRKHKPAVWYTAVTSIPAALMEVPTYRAEDHIYARFMLNAGTPDVLQALQNRFAGKSMTSYGMTEAAGLATVCAPVGTLEERTENVGRAVDGMEIRIVDPITGSVLDYEQPGEIQYRGTTFERYYGNPAATAQTREPDGWCHSGDIGKLSSSGALTYLSRLKDMLKVGGENVAPVEVEQCLSDHPAVKLVQVVGLPDARLGEVPVAFVELRPDIAASEAELMAHCETSLARFKRPRQIRFIREWPQSITLGKIQKAALREMLLEPAESKEMDNAD